MFTPYKVVQQVTTSGTSAQSAAFGSTTKMIRVVATQDCTVLIGSNPTALTTSLYLVAKVPEFFSVQPGQKIAALQVASGGVLSIAEGETGLVT